MNNEISITWKDGLAFEAESEGHHLILDSAEDKGGRNLGVRPKPLMLIALAGCTGMDVVSILQKMRVKLDHFKLKVDGTESEETPKRYTKMHIIYEFWGEDLSYEKLEKAINLSQEKYCGVLAFYKEVIPVTYSILTHHSKEMHIGIEQPGSLRN